MLISNLYQKTLHRTIFHCESTTERRTSAGLWMRYAALSKFGGSSGAMFEKVLIVSFFVHFLNERETCESPIAMYRKVISNLVFAEIGSRTIFCFPLAV